MTTVSAGIVAILMFGLGLYIGSMVHVNDLAHLERRNGGSRHHRASSEEKGLPGSIRSNGKDDNK